MSEQMDWKIFVNLCELDDISPMFAWTAVQDSINKTKEIESKIVKFEKEYRQECKKAEIDDLKLTKQRLEEQLNSFVDKNGYLRQE